MTRRVAPWSTPGGSGRINAPLNRPRPPPSMPHACVADGSAWRWILRGKPPSNPAAPIWACRPSPKATAWAAPRWRWAGGA
ncbi:hypothetical protein G6F61_015231 [Rhizopus arrhizus]|nr:hypothetical protein G6F61_015231 [Rhizopus arrhizus]